ncbi:MAG TPA: VWA domain-containing protein [Vicinamibacterales bacterium]|jgi:Ca-activated chloride channel family protein
MRRAACVLAFAAAAAAGIGAQQRVQQPFRAGVELVSLNVTVTDPSTGKYDTTLDQPNFQIYEDGVKQNLTFFSKTQQPISLSLLLDTSASMEERMGIAQDAAIGLIRQLHPADEAEVLDFDSEVRVLSPFTHDGAALQKAIRATTANGSTSLYNAVYIALKDLKKVKANSPNDIRRQAIVLLSDGDDTSSLVDFDQVLDLAKRSETAIYSIGLRQGEIAREEFHQAEFVLRQLSEQTGGRVFYPTDARELSKIYQTIWDELSSQYTMAYSSSNPKRDGAWRRIVVRVASPGPPLIARTKQGYYGPTGS